MRLSTICTLVSTLPALHAFVLPDLRDESVQKVFATFEKSSNKNQQTVDGEFDEEIISNDPFFHVPAVVEDTTDAGLDYARAWAEAVGDAMSDRKTKIVSVLEMIKGTATTTKNSLVESMTDVWDALEQDFDDPNTPPGPPEHPGPPPPGPPKGPKPPHRRPPPPHDEPPHDRPPHDKPAHGRPPHDEPPHGRPPHDKPAHDRPPHDEPPHGRPPHDEPPHGRPPHDKPPHGRPPHHGPPPPHHGHHPHDLTNYTIYENIGKSNFTKKAFAYINKDAGLVKILNSTSANVTFFVPLDSAFDHVPDHDKDVMEQHLKNILYYHAAKDVFPAGKVLISHTIPSMLKEADLGGPDELQRIRVGLGLGGLRLNFYSKIVVADLFSSNGVIHGIDHILIPPPPARKAISLLPSSFSTLESALYKTGVIKNITNSTAGLTIFAPSNRAFERLGPRALAFLFSSYGRKYLKSLIEYHIVSGQILYSDAYIKGEDNDNADAADFKDLPRGRFHTDLETLNGKSLSIDIVRFGRFINFKVNAFTSIVVQDGIVKDGVIQVPNSVLLPPKTSPPSAESNDYDDGYPMTIEELKERLEPLL